MTTPSVSQSEWRRYTQCPRQYLWGKDRPRTRTTERERRTLLGVTVDEVIARMYEAKWLTDEPALLIPRLQHYAKEILEQRFHEYSVAESVETLAFELQPLWLNILPTVKAFKLYAPRVAVRHDFSAVINGVRFWGQPDLTFFGDTTDVIDVKLRSKSSLEAKQLRAYQVLVEAHGHQVSRIGYWLPRDAMVYQKKVMSPATRKTFVTALGKDLQAMVSCSDEPRTGSHCQFCEHRGDCKEGAVYLTEKKGSVANVVGEAYQGKPMITGF